MWCARYFLGPDSDVDEMEEPCQFASVPLLCLLISMCCVLHVKNTLQKLTSGRVRPIILYRGNWLCYREEVSSCGV